MLEIFIVYFRWFFFYSPRPFLFLRCVHRSSYSSFLMRRPVKKKKKKRADKSQIYKRVHTARLKMFCSLACRRTERLLDVCMYRYKWQFNGTYACRRLHASVSVAICVLAIYAECCSLAGWALPYCCCCVVVVYHQPTSL